MAKMTSSEAFVETMVANDVTDIFGIMGSAFMDAMDIFEPAGIRFIPVVHEQGAAHMADGYSRVSGRHGVVIGQNGRIVVFEFDEIGLLDLLDENFVELFFHGLIKNLNGLDVKALGAVFVSGANFL